MSQYFRDYVIATTLVCSFFILVCAAEHDTEHVRTRTGTLIPFREVSRFVQTAADASSKIYEVTSDNVLIGPDMHVDLHQTTAPLHIPKSTPTLFKNSERFMAPVHDFSLRMGQDLIVAYSSIGHVLGVWGGRHTLIPVRSGTSTVLIDDESEHADGTGELEDDHPVDQSLALPSVFGTMANALKIETPSNESRQRKKFEIAVAFDNEFCAIYKNSYETAVAVVNAVFAAANAPYKNQTNVDLSVVHIEGHCEDERDPYRRLQRFKSTRETRIVAEIEAFWKLRRRNVQRDAMMLLTGFEQKFFNGEAYFASTCNGSGYSWATRARIRTVVHELAHLLGCRHTDSGIMKTGSNISIPPDVFTNTSLVEMHDYLNNNPRSACITP